MQRRESRPRPSATPSQHHHHRPHFLHLWRMEITHIHYPLSCPNPLPMQTDRRPHFSNCGDICRFYDPFVPSTYSIKCHAMLSTHSRTEMYFVPVPRRFRDCSKKTRRGKRDRVPNHHALVSVAVAVAVALFFSGVRKSPIYHRRLRNRVCTRKKKKGREGKGRKGRRATKKCLDFWGNCEWPRGIPPKLASLSLRLLHLFNAAAFGFGFAVMLRLHAVDR